MDEKAEHEIRERAAETLKPLKEKIEQEIENHPNWCSPRCQTFLPNAYREARLRGTSAEQVQEDYDLCHMFR